MDAPQDAAPPESSGSATPGEPLGTTPGVLGPYQVTGRWHHDHTGEVLSGQDAAGRQVELVLMGPGPASDAAARDRFRATLDQVALERPGGVVNAETRGPLVWAALAAGSGPEPATRLLTTALPGGAQVDPRAGPSFAPHWSGSHSSYPVPHAPVPTPPPPAGVSRRVWWWLAVGLLLVLALLILAACWPREDDAIRQPTPSPSQVVPTPSPSSPSPSPSTPGPSRSGDTTTGPAEPEASAGAVPEQPLAPAPFGVEGDTVEQRLPGVPFPFRTPPGWTCVLADQSPTSVEYVCTDVAALTEDPTSPMPSGSIVVTRCEDGCDPAELELLRSVDGDLAWEQEDATTWWNDQPNPSLPRFQWIRLSKAFAVESGTATQHVYAAFRAPPAQYDTVVAIVNDIATNAT